MVGPAVDAQATTAGVLAREALASPAVGVMGDARGGTRGPVGGGAVEEAVEGADGVMPAGASADIASGPSRVLGARGAVVGARLPHSGIPPPGGVSTTKEGRSMHVNLKLNPLTVNGCGILAMGNPKKVWRCKKKDV